MAVITPPLFETERGDWQPTSDDHYTPAWLFDAMGLEFDLDVASPPGGVPWIPAKRFYTVHDDGLSQPWSGLVWCNPPFSAVSPWASRWAVCNDGVFLACVSKAKWTARLWAASEAIWIPGDRQIEFAQADGAPNKHIPFLVFVAGRGEGTQGVVNLARNCGSAGS